MGFEIIVEALNAKKSGDRYMAKCPAHGDKSPSLMVSERENGSTWLHCFAGCTPDEILSAVGLSPSEAWKPLKKIDHPVYVRKMERCSRICDAINRDIADIRALDGLSQIESFQSLERLCPSVFNNPKRIDQKTRELAMKARLEWYGAAASSITSKVMLAVLFDMSFKMGAKHDHA